MASIKISDLFQQLGEWQDFAALFHDYKIFGDLPDLFGRDEPLSIPYTHHIHLATTPALQAKWARIEFQYRRTTEVGKPEHDIWLLYAYDDCRDEYLLLTIIGPDAHNRAEWRAYLRTILIEIVEPWVIGKTLYPDY